ncbi:YdcF family protein [Leptolyngbya sp. FACHB-261]|uniref:YdcF family protein n=1 Tax=Leptolyngbya sp. FACHB-261 TaxID=2692806 RepID=UPI0016898BEB|nr:YdcF family protein [Leptolyngbya sp. FACHB-261]MBD2100563.1 YdcF family protein [Leptolyngbya sp. FACHB-261]
MFLNFLLFILLWILLLWLAYRFLSGIISPFFLTVLGALLLVAAAATGLSLFFVETPAARAIWEILAFPFTPIGLIFLLLLSSLRQGKLGSLLPIALVLLYLFSNPILAERMAGSLEQEAARQLLQEPTSPLNGGAAADAIVVVGNPTRPPLPPRPMRIPEVTESGDLLIYASQLYQGGQVRGDGAVVVSSGPRVGLQGRLGCPPGCAQITGQVAPGVDPEATDMATFLSTFGVPADRIVQDAESSTLRRTAERIRGLLTDRGLGSRILLVTTALQMPRAAGTFRNVGFQVYPAPVDFFVSQPNTTEVQRRFSPRDFLPDADALALSTRAWNEYLLQLLSFLLGWLSPPCPNGCVPGPAPTAVLPTFTGLATLPPKLISDPISS